MLEAPDWGALDTVWRSPLPFVLWPVCGAPVLSYWLDEALRNGAEKVTVVAADRPHQVRAWIEKGNYWSKPVEVSPVPVSAGDARVERMDVLPGQVCGEAVDSGKSLLARWFELHPRALELRASQQLSIDREISPGVWVGPGAMVDPGATLTAPVWIGSRARVGPGCRLGPNAFIGAHSVLDEDVEVLRGVVCPETYVGAHTGLRNSATQGGLLLDWDKGVAVRIVEDFILSDLGRRGEKPRMVERLAAFVGWLCLAPVAAVIGGPETFREVLLSSGATIRLGTRARGPLVVRRAAWLAQVAAGRLRLVGVLPRAAAEWELLEPELRAAIERSPAGVFALSDLYDCHDPSSPDEWMHAAYQAASPDGSGLRQARQALPAIARKVPIA